VIQHMVGRDASDELSMYVLLNYPPHNDGASLCKFMSSADGM
jgi:hypothetical protein